MNVPHRAAAVVLASATVLALAGCVNINPDQEERTTADPPSTAAPPQELPPTAVSSGPPAPGTAPSQVPPQPASIPPEVPPDWTDTLEQVSTGVTRISMTTCDGAGGSGSGFLVGEDLIATAAHVVAGASSLTVEPAGRVSEAEVIGYSEEADLALLRIPEPVAGHVFSWSAEPLRIGQEVSALGYPRSAGFTSVQGSISSLNPQAEGLNDTARYVQTDAAVNPGNSGGPLVTVDGEVAGVVQSKWDYTPDGRPIEGMNFALSYEDAQPLIEDWTASPQPPAPVECPVAPGVPESTSDVSVDVTVTTDHESAAMLAQSLAVHGQAINTGQYDVAFDLFTPSLQEQMEGLETWRQGLISTFWRELQVADVTGAGDTLTARTWVRTEQSATDGPDGQTCSWWALDYTMVPDEERGIWLIDEVSSREDPSAC
ncbi:S1C family serine protease [Kocuria rosea]|uniref:S1C family serine protease n=1 Tax=Kocuria rosea TaxID=1275 RepID=UPI002540A18B|nr:S1C family serine protease [Kocuria rosea]WIG17449.1 S1C family serine protease [Kocuria rosea]